MVTVTSTVVPSGPTVTVPDSPAAASISGSIMGVLWAWLEREPLSPPDVAAEWMWRALTQSRPSDR